ncbi:ORF6C domain-containing protein [Clostridium tertium]|uniref:ORF6C domain-containing protein n=1 Tax=Clostridium tertium TaxID=1559 RepID=UPI00232E4D41|nr:ORF6C domain-containing protein [Clostridium tertium]MDB1932950.1 ORF6C domain-containing protein [Clostridium tertium]MDB1938310.1 ORF6C domain-containing protein [Clostridium tertium]
MNNLIKINGLVNIEGMQFHNIEGGFGKGKKAMLAKEIAEIHGRELKFINQNINRNIKRFTEGLDIVDLKGTQFEVTLSNHGIYTQNSINASNNIYLLSERGYSKLLKILEDDVAWEQYEKLVDGYFNMRGQAKLLSTEEMLELQFKYAKEVKEKVDKVDNRVTVLEERMTIETGAQKVLQDLVNKKVMAILGGKDSPAYKELAKKTYSQCWKDYKRIVGVASYKDTAIKDFDFAKKVIIDWKPNRELELMIRGCNAQIRM